MKRMKRYFWKGFNNEGKCIRTMTLTNKAPEKIEIPENAPRGIEIGFLEESSKCARVILSIIIETLLIFTVFACIIPIFPELSVTIEIKSSYEMFWFIVSVIA